MDMGAVRSAECERARSQVSLALDNELSEFEQASLRAHVGRCVTCAAFACELGALTQELRASRRERPTAEVMPPRRRAATRVVQLTAAAAAVVLAAGLGSLAGSLSSRHTATATVASGRAGHLLDRGRDRGSVVPIGGTQQSAPSRPGPSVAF
jgi:predicted anti-sigma-YlaC factor YlaD